MVLICISVVSNDAQHLCMCLLTLWVSIFGEMLFQSFAYFLMSYYSLYSKFNFLSPDFCCSIAN